MRKYYFIGWPEYQEYMESNECIYIAETDEYAVPCDMYDGDPDAELSDGKW